MVRRSGFRRWAEETLGTASPAVVQRYLVERNVHVTDEFCRQHLAGTPQQIVLSDWIEICEATGRPLRSFFDYEPTGRPANRPPKRRGAKAAQTPAAPPRSPFRTPPPRD